MGILPLGSALLLCVNSTLIGSEKKYNEFRVKLVVKHNPYCQIHNIHGMGQVFGFFSSLLQYTEPKIEYLAYPLLIQIWCAAAAWHHGTLLYKMVNVCNVCAVPQWPLITSCVCVLIVEVWHHHHRFSLPYKWTYAILSIINVAVFCVLLLLLLLYRWLYVAVRSFKNATFGFVVTNSLVVIAAVLCLVLYRHYMAALFACTVCTFMINVQQRLPIK